MKLLTKEILNNFKKQGDTSRMKPEDIKIVVKFFNPCRGQTWYATEFDAEDRIFFGLVSLFNDWNDERGSFSLDELLDYKGPLGIGIERDMYFGNHTLREVMDGGRP